MAKKKQHKATATVHAGAPAASQGGAFNPSITMASTFHFAGDVEHNTDAQGQPIYQYGRFHQPSWTPLEHALSSLEVAGSDHQAGSLVFPSGMAAVAAVLTSFVKTGDTIMLPSDGYYATRAYAERFLTNFGVNVIAVPTIEIPKQDFSSIQLVFVESPSNPLLDVIDLKQLAEKTRQADTILAVDNTTMTPLGQQPLLLGADISMCSGTKALNGHSDVVFGYVSSLQPSLLEAMESWRKLSGNIPGPMEAWLVHRGLASLDMRLERMVSNATVIAERLSEKLSMVRYPGLANDPSHTIATEQMHNFGFVVSFDLDSKEKAEQFLSRLQLIYQATSFGGMHSMAERRARWGTDDVSEGLIRLSVGCEHVDDIWGDIEQALASAR